MSHSYFKTFTAPNGFAVPFEFKVTKIGSAARETTRVVAKIDMGDEFFLSPAVVLEGIYWDVSLPDMIEDEIIARIEQSILTTLSAYMPADEEDLKIFGIRPAEELIAEYQAFAAKEEAEQDEDNDDAGAEDALERHIRRVEEAEEADMDEIRRFMRGEDDEDTYAFEDLDEDAQQIAIQNARSQWAGDVADDEIADWLMGTGWSFDVGGHKM